MTAEWREPSLEERLNPPSEVFAGSEIVPESGAHYTFEATLKRGVLGALWSLTSLVEVAGKRSKIRDKGCAATMEARGALDRAKVLRRRGPIDGAWPTLRPSPDITLEMIPGWRRRRDCLPPWWRMIVTMDARSIRNWPYRSSRASRLKRSRR
jgi:hypothetical protein